MGGIVGYLQDNSNIKDCINLGKVSGNGSLVGGIVGRFIWNCEIINSRNEGIVERCLWSWSESLDLRMVLGR